MTAAARTAIKLMRSLYLDEFQNLKMCSPLKKDFAAISYSKWALKELINRVGNSDQPPLMVIEEFRDELDDYSTRNTTNSFMFSTAKDTVEWVIDLLTN